jgi:hypothetical protein
MLALLWEILIGLVIGVIAKLIMPGKDPGGILVTIIIGNRRFDWCDLPGTTGWLVQAGSVGRIHDVSSGGGVDPVDLSSG